MLLNDSKEKVSGPRRVSSFVVHYMHSWVSVSQSSLLPENKNIIRSLNTNLVPRPRTVSIRRGATKKTKKKNYLIRIVTRTSPIICESQNPGQRITTWNFSVKRSWPSVTFFNGPVGLSLEVSGFNREDEKTYSDFLFCIYLLRNFNNSYHIKFTYMDTHSFWLKLTNITSYVICCIYYVI